ncbi:unnamed protein product [Caenorhabditis auriculariae]|uniref:Sphingomyelin phosphodiesterase n=1 Tax=Caenorhabditis auriculariae TaxID=2777116 RepID=A0A8S1HWB9_9PELO|nr:unnamed protein product [Caenorhabditis auriculariae]
MKFGLYFLPLLLVFATYDRAEALTECEQCVAAVDLLQVAWGEKTTEACVVDLAIFICETFHIVDNFICNDEFMWVVERVIITPHEMCGLLMNDNCGNFTNPLLSKWDIPIPGGQPPFYRPEVPQGKPTLRALHLTDLHVDMFYTPGLEAQCDTPLCCRPQDINSEIALGAVKEPAQYWGTVGNCDAPYYLLTNMLQHIASSNEIIDYVMVSGDVVSHAVWAYTNDAHAAMVRNISDTIRSYFPTTPVYFAVGNHEGVPIDNFAPHFTPKKFHMDWLYGTMATSWKGWVPADQIKTLEYNGCYTVNVAPGLRVISINNAYGDTNNFWLYVNQTDPDGTLQWLIGQLLDAEQKGDKVHIVAHIPGSNGEALEGFAINYYKIMNRFANTVVAQFFGHTHSESFYMIYADPEDFKSTPTGVVYSAPSLTTYSDFFPAYRIFTIDGVYEGSTYQVIDYEEWYFNLTENNANPSNPTWKHLYQSANAEYGLKSQSPAEYNNMIERMKTDDVLFQKFYEHHYRRTKYDGLSECTGNCKLGYLCSPRQFHHEDKLCSDLQGFERVSMSPRKKSIYKNTDGKRRRNSDECPI